MVLGEGHDYLFCKPFPSLERSVPLPRLSVLHVIPSERLSLPVTTGDISFRLTHYPTGSFRIPSPGRPKSEVPLKEPFIDVGKRVHDVNDPHARNNYRIVVIIPTDVEKLDISDYEKSTRINWTFVEDESSNYGGDERRGRWEETELWP